MTVIRTKTNMVIAEEIAEDHQWVQVVWHGPPDEGSRYRRAFIGPRWPIDQYESTVEWAVGMADYMRFPLYVVPLGPKDLP